MAEFEEDDYLTDDSDSDIDLDEFGDVRKKTVVKKGPLDTKPVDEEEAEEDEEEEDEDDLDILDEEEDDLDILDEDDDEKDVPLHTTFGEIQTDDEDDDDDEDADEHYLQKFDANIEKNIIRDFHPELKVHSFDEIKALCRIVYDDAGNIVDPLHKTMPFVTKYEKARVLGERAKQINAGAEPFVEVDDSVIDGYLIALKEYDEKKIPFIVQRPLPNGDSEYWRLKDLEIL